MSQPIQLQIRLFGVFRKLHPSPVALTVATGTTVRAIKTALGLELQKLNGGIFKEQDLLAQSALATDHAVLEDGACLTENAQLAILPPVCGG